MGRLLCGIPYKGWPVTPRYGTAAVQLFLYAVCNTELLTAAGREPLQGVARHTKVGYSCGGFCYSRKEPMAIQAASVCEGCGQAHELTCIP
jgi:hypothetical protein